MFGGGLPDEVITLVEQWVPQRNYRSEKKFQNDLQDYLDVQLNEPQGAVLGGQPEPIPVKKDFGRVNADIAVGHDIGIELKRDFTNSNKHRLSGQITEYQKEFPTVIVVSCGISDMDGWRELQNEYGGQPGFGMQQSEVVFIHKQKEHFGKDPSDINDGGGLFGGSGIF